MNYADHPLTIVNPVANTPLVFAPSNAEIVTVSVELPPGDPGLPPHRHPGPVYAYLIEGEIIFELEDEAPRTIRAGEAFWEPGGDRIHYVAANPNDAAARFVAMLFVPPGEELLTLVDETELEARRDRRVGP